MGNKILRFIEDVGQNIRSNKLFNRLLVAISLIYPIVLIIISWKDIVEIDFFAFFKTLLICFFIYCVSLIMQFLCWFLFINGNKENILEDLSVYLSALLMRRMPGGFWHWVGRSTLYVNPGNEKTSNVSSGNLIEWITLILVGMSSYLIFGGNPWGIIILGIAYLFLLYCFTRRKFKKVYIYVFPIIIISLYLLCWALGGYILAMLGNRLSPDSTLQINQYISFWSLTGASSTLLFFLPGGLGIREVSLTYLLNPYLAFSQIILLALELRLVFLFSELILGGIGLAMNRSIIKKKR